MSTPNSNNPPVTVTMHPLSMQAHAIQFDVSLPPTIATDAPKYLGHFSAEQERDILALVRKTMKDKDKPSTQSSSNTKP